MKSRPDTILSKPLYSRKLSTERITIEQFWQSKHRQLLAYPTGTQAVLIKRYDALQNHGIEALYCFGHKSLEGLPVLGWGRCGVVLLAERADQRIALKIRRMDAVATSLHPEARLLAIANDLNIGPTYQDHSPNFLCMTYIQGPTLAQWLQIQQHRAPRIVTPILKDILKDLLEQAFRLDQAQLNHGNLRSVRDHVILSPQGPVLLDFSSASPNPNPVNLAHLTQGLFLGGAMSKMLKRYMTFPPKEDLVDVLRHYKQTSTVTQFNQLLRLIDLTTPSSMASQRQS